MNEQDFRKFLKKGGRSASACERITEYVQTFEEYLQGHAGKNLQEATPQDLEGFVEWP